MSTTEQVEAPAVEAAPAEAPATEVQEEPKKAEKPVREKKPRAPKEKKPTQPKTASHPPYFQMIKEALLALNEKSGSSPYAIAKYMEEKHKAVLPANFRKTLALQLKNSASRGKLIKIKASYKLSEAGKKEKSTTKAKVSKPKQIKTTTSAPTKAPRKPAAKKNKKSTPAKKPKQPKSIKSPAAKKSKKAAVA